jgi:hypothetical protein
LLDVVQQLHVRQPSTHAKPDAACAVLGSWWWAVCRPKHVELHLKEGTIKFWYTAASCLIFHCKNYTMIHGSTNIKIIIWVTRAYVHTNARLHVNWVETTNLSQIYLSEIVPSAYNNNHSGWCLGNLVREVIRCDFAISCWP